MTSRHALAAVFLIASSAAAASDLAEASRKAGGSFDLMIDDATIIDGTGAPPFEADVLVDGDVIAFIGHVPDGQVRAERSIKAGARVLTPGFIDTHTHGDAEKDSFESYLAMGVTTIVLGQDGRGPSMKSRGKDLPPAEALAPWMERVSARGVELNVAALSGHGTLRHLAGVLDSAREITPQQNARMAELLREDLQAGGYGLSTGLEYVPGRYAETAELVPLAKEVADADGLIVSHMRTEDDGLIEGALEELLSYGGEARVQASHLKIVFGKGEEKADRLLGLIEARQSAGTKLTADVYPYTAGYGGLDLVFPEWALPPADYVKIAAARRSELLAYLKARMSRRGGADALLFGSGKLAGKTLAMVAAERKKPFEQVLLEIGPRGAHGAHFIMDPVVQDRLVISPLTAISTDGGPSMRHPRSTGTYARLIEHYVQSKKMISLEEAVRKSSSLPAAAMGLTDRGVIRAGAKADLLLFDPAMVRAKSDYLNPFAKAEGFDIVIVNGKVARENGTMSSARHGRVLKRGRKQ